MIRVPVRLTLAIAGSIAVHAAVVSLYGPAGVGTVARVAESPVLHAILAPAESRPEAPAKELERLVQPEPAAGRAGGDAGNGLPAPDRWLRRSELDEVAKPVTGVRLEYPESASGLRSAQVQLRLFIDERGIVRKLTLEEPGPERAFDEAAVKAWQAVRFSPAMKDGLAVKSQQVVEIDFQPELR